MSSLLFLRSFYPALLNFSECSQLSNFLNSLPILISLIAVKFDYQLGLEVGETTLQLEDCQQMRRMGAGGGGGGSESNSPFFIVSKYGTKQIMLKQHTFNRHITREDVTYWRCSQFAVLRCRARLKTKLDTLTILNSEHNHEVISKARKYGSLKRQRAEAQAAAKAPKEEPAEASRQEQNEFEFVSTKHDVNT